MDDWDLFLRGIGGDDDAFGELVRKCDRLLRSCVMRAGRGHLSGWRALDDIIQDTWCKAAEFGRCGRFNRSRKFTSWLWGVCLNKVDGKIDRFPARGQGGDDARDDSANEPSDTRNDPAKDAADMEMSEALTECLGRVQERLKKVYELIYEDGLKAPAAARVLGCSDTYVREGLLPRLWELLEKCLGGKGFGSIDVSPIG